MDTNITSYPLSWPVAWKRTPRQRIRRSRFGTWNTPPSTHKGTQALLDELRLLGAANVVISTNLRLRNDGLPYSSQRDPEDAGAAVYFQLDKKPRVLACDAWQSVGENLYAIAKHVEALRGQERWGVGTLEQAFTGYAALPAPADEAQWWTVLNVERTVSAGDLKRVYYALARKHHPDRGGDEEEFKKITRAYNAGLIECEARR